MRRRSSTRPYIPVSSSIDKASITAKRFYRHWGARLPTIPNVLLRDIQLGRHGRHAHSEPRDGWHDRMASRESVDECCNQQRERQQIRTALDWHNGAILPSCSLSELFCSRWFEFSHSPNKTSKPRYSNGTDQIGTVRGRSHCECVQRLLNARRGDQERH